MFGSALIFILSLSFVVTFADAFVDLDAWFTEAADIANIINEDSGGGDIAEEEEEEEEESVLNKRSS